MTPKIDEDLTATKNFTLLGLLKPMSNKKFISKKVKFYMELKSKNKRDTQIIQFVA